VIQPAVDALHNQITMLQTSILDDAILANYLALMISGCERTTAILHRQPPITDAHDLCSPLNAVSGFAELLLVDEHPLTADQRAALIAIREEAKTLIISVKASYGQHNHV